MEQNKLTTNLQDRGNWTSASSAGADRLCPGRHQAQAGLPDVKSDDADFGTQIHDALAKNDPVKLSPEQLRIFEMCSDLTTKHVQEVFGLEYEKAKVWREKRFWVNIKAISGDTSQQPKMYQHSAQLDALFILGDKGLIIEYKTLKGDVEEASSNEQLRDQAVIAAGTFKLKEVVTLIAQPLVTMSPAPCLYNETAIAKAQKEMYVRVRNSNAPKAKRVAGPVQCKFCKARFTCSEYEQWSASLLPETAPVIGVPLASWTPQQRTYFLTMRGAAQKWLDDAYDFIKEGLRNDPEFAPGFTLKPGLIRRPINDPQELFNRILASSDSSGLKAEEVLPLYLQCVDVKKGDVEALVRKLTSLKGKAFKTHMEELFAGITDEKPNDSSVSKV